MIVLVVAIGLRIAERVAGRLGGCPEAPGRDFG
jgi:hypothetical protein